MGMKAMHVEINGYDDDEKNDYVRSEKTMRMLSKYNDRILICSKNGNNKMMKLLLSYLLHKLDISNVHYLSIPMIAANISKENVFQTILSKINLAISSGIGVIIIYDLDIWLNTFPKIIETVLLSNINDMCRDRNTLLLVTCNQEWNATNCWKNEWTHTIYQYFSDHRHNFTIQ